MADATDDYRIKVNVDSSDVGSGVDDTVSQLEKVDDATKKLTESSHSLQGEQLGSLRTAHHLFEGIKELSEGGVEAFAGLATEGRVVGEVLEEALGPSAPFLIILTTLLSVGIPALTRAFGTVGKEGKEGMSEATDGARNLKSSVDLIKDSIDQVITAQGQIQSGDSSELKALQDQTEELKNQADAYKKLQQAKEAYEDAELGLTIANLERDKQKALQGVPAGSGRDAIEANYESLELDARQKRASQKAQEEVDAKKTELEEATNAYGAKQKEIAREQYNLRELQQERSGNIGSLKDAQDTSAAAQTLLQSSGIVSIRKDEKGDVTGLITANGEDLQKTTQANLDSYRALANQKRESLRTGGYMSQDVPGVEAELAEMDKKADLAQTDLARLRNAARDLPVYGETEKALEPALKKATENIQSQEEKIKLLQASLGPLYTNRDAAVENVLTARVKQATLIPTQTTEDVALDDKQRKAKEQRGLTDRQADREGLESELESAIKATVNEKAKGALEIQLAKLKSSGEQDQADFRYKFDEIDSHQRGATYSKAQAGQADAATEAAKQAQVAQDKTLTEQIRQGKALIESSGDTAAIRDMDSLLRGITDKTQQMAVLTALLAGHQDHLGAALDAHISQSQAHAARTDQHLKSIDRRLKSNNNFGGSN